MSTVTVDYIPGHDGVRIAVHRLGAGRPVVMLHGLSSSAQVNWIPYGTAQAVADAGFEAIMIDQRVHGLSEVPQAADAYPPDVMALDMEIVIPALGLGAFDLVGYSMGSRLAVKLIGRGLAPEKLILGGMGLEGLTNWKARRDHFLALLDRFDTAKAGDADFVSISFMRSRKVDPVALSRLLLSMTDIAPEVLDRITMPTLVLCGADDSDNGSADALVQALPNARRGTIPGNHMSAVTMPSFGAAIVDYLLA
ncbi:alpha/beta fold hydrolase [Sphingobium nicotianae]|uniref:Alpha/beta hydrolase n=1 Tax=Sphingobium nicotianae TaxID=2782607 RepID=A0A9X1DD82_9SPHN|nr:alpha/beta fold hydrolase [Sphingobium nicotianae]MBT2187764.1 alpha/beta hydrolase [Sphingobium nicotianae]